MVDSQVLLREISKKGFGPFTGVPCSILNPLIQNLQTENSFTYFGATSEGEAMGLAAGFVLTGAMPVVLMQNSGLGNAINPLVSLQLVYKLPVLFLISLRGEVGSFDAPEHKIMGQITEKILEVCDIKYEYLTNENGDIGNQLSRIYNIINGFKKVAAIIIRKSSIKDFPVESSIELSELISRKEAIQTVLAVLKNKEAIVSTTGKISRELYYENKSAKNNFYMLGSMGCAPSIASGIALRDRKRKIVVFDGDGALLMKMGILATVGHYSPEGFIHILLDNESYASTGGQATVSSTVNFSKIADNAGYNNSVSVRKKEELVSAVEKALITKGPHFIHVKVLKGLDPELGRVELPPADIKENFMDFLKEKNE